MVGNSTLALPAILTSQRACICLPSRLTSKDSVHDKKVRVLHATSPCCRLPRIRRSLAPNFELWRWCVFISLCTSKSGLANAVKYWMSTGTTDRHAHVSAYWSLAGRQRRFARLEFAEKEEPE